MCRLHHGALLDAAHIVPDGQPKAEPVVPDGLALCKIDHAAYDENLIGVRPISASTRRPGFEMKLMVPCCSMVSKSGRYTAPGPPPAGRSARPERLAYRYEQFKGAS